jgi:hypothetical protein
LRAWGTNVVGRRGIARARVAAARKLAVILRRIWADDSEFRRGEAHDLLEWLMGEDQLDLRNPNQTEVPEASTQFERCLLEAVSKPLRGDLNPDESLESKRSPIPGAYDVDPRDPGRA